MSVGNKTQGPRHRTNEPSAESQLKTSSEKEKKPPSPRNCREFIRRETSNAMLDIVNTFVDEAKGGSVPHFNALTKIGGFDQRLGSSDAPKRRGKSLARRMLDEVERYEAKRAAELAAANASTSQPEVPQTGRTGQTGQTGPQERS